jgi:hypothetical protein
VPGNSVADPDPVPVLSLHAGSGMGPDPGSVSVMKNSDHISESLKTIFWVKILKFFDADPDLGSRIFMTLDPGWKKSGSGIPDPQQCLVHT